MKQRQIKFRSLSENIKVKYLFTVNVNYFTKWWKDNIELIFNPVGWFKYLTITKLK